MFLFIGYLILKKETIHNFTPILFNHKIIKKKRVHSNTHFCNVIMLKKKIVQIPSTRLALKRYISYKDTPLSTNVTSQLSLYFGSI